MSLTSVPESRWSHWVCAGSSGAGSAPRVTLWKTSRCGLSVTVTSVGPLPMWIGRSRSSKKPAWPTFSVQSPGGSDIWKSPAGPVWASTAGAAPQWTATRAAGTGAPSSSITRPATLTWAAAAAAHANPAMRARRMSKGPADAEDRHKIVQPAAGPGAGRGRNDGGGKWREVIAQVQAQQPAVRERILQAAAEGEERAGLGGGLQNCEFRQGTHTAGDFGAAVEFHAGAGRGKWTEPFPAGGGVEEHFAEQRMRFPIQIGFARAGLQREVAILKRVAGFGPEMFRPVEAARGAERKARPESGLCGAVGIGDRYIAIESESDARADFPILGESRGCENQYRKERGGESHDIRGPHAIGL